MIDCVGGHHHHHGLKKQQPFSFVTQKVGGLGGEGGCGKDTHSIVGLWLE